MPLPDRRVAAAALAALAITACTATSPLAQDSVLYVREAMQQKINPAILAIWDIGNNAMSDDGGIDPAQMDDTKWASLEEAAVQLGEASREMASATQIHAAQDDNMETADGEVTMAAVQGFIDADPAGFRALASAQADHVDELVAAAQAKNAEAAGNLIAELDSACESCHARYWYPE